MAPTTLTDADSQLATARALIPHIHAFLVRHELVKTAKALVKEIAKAGGGKFKDVAVEDEAFVEAPLEVVFWLYKEGKTVKDLESANESESESGSESESDSESDSDSDSESESESESSSASESEKEDLKPAPKKLSTKIEKAEVVVEESSSASSSSAESDADADSDSDSESESDSSDDATVPQKTTTKVMTNGKRKREVAESSSSSDENADPKRVKSPSGSSTPSSNSASTDPSRRFSRIDRTAVKFEDRSLQDNRYQGRAGTWGEVANEKLMQVRGRDFTKNKNKMKRGSYRGGSIGLQSGSYKFTD
ncbi:SRP40, C-terminal domain-containing protein [Lipomyces orientalis]|uniref:SRP40, C-terminal domain-containing protein n=1 Tax=Lipomyces orientalis TaxID=1233043 RepID=A0ACC3TFU3_9ASCO